MKTEDTFNHRLQENLIRTPVEGKSKSELAEQLAIDSPEPYSKEAKVKELQDYFTKAQECFQALVKEVGEIKSIEELQAKRPAIKAIHGDFQSSLCRSLDAIIYGY